MASSSSNQQDIPETTSSMQQLQEPERAAYLMGGYTMKLKEHQLSVQVENPVDFSSLLHHGCNIKGFYNTQGWQEYFRMMNGPTYKALVRHFLVRASIFDKKSSRSRTKEFDSMLSRTWW
jgi:hypothetical protein